MKKTLRNCMLGIGLALVLAPAAYADDDLVTQSQQTIANFIKADPSLQMFLEKAAGYAVFPTIAKGGFVVGGAHGSGVLYDSHKPIGTVKVSQASIGAQAGGQTFSEIIFFDSTHALEDFKAGKFEMSAEANAIAAASGASKTANYKDGVAVFTMGKQGLMFQASVGGQKFKYEPMK